MRIWSIFVSPFAKSLPPLSLISPYGTTQTYDIWYSSYGWDEFVEITECREHCTPGCRSLGYACGGGSFGIPDTTKCCSGHCIRGQCARKPRPKPQPKPKHCKSETQSCKRDSDCCQYRGKTKVIVS